MNHAHLTGWLDGNTVNACAFKLLYWRTYIHYGFVTLIIVGIWLAAARYPGHWYNRICDLCGTKCLISIFASDLYSYYD